MPSVNLYNNTIAAMNSRLDVVLWSKDQNIAFERVFAKMEEVVNKVEMMLSMYHPNAEVFNLNQKAFDTPVEVSEGLFSLVKRCIDYHAKTNGYFNIAYKSRLNKQGSIGDDLFLDEADNTITYTSKEVQLDFGGIGKGFALGEIATLLKQECVLNVFISFGGSSILTRGRHPYGDYWPFALEDGRNTNLKMNDSAVSISGFHEGITKVHVTNPKTGELKHRQKIVEIQMSCPEKAEVLSTALLVAPESEHEAIKKRFELEYSKVIPL